MFGMAIDMSTERPQSLCGNLLHTTTNQPTQRIQDIQPTPQLATHHTTTTMVPTHKLTQPQLTRPQPTPTIQEPPTHTTMLTTMAMATGGEHTPHELM